MIPKMYVYLVLIATLAAMIGFGLTKAYQRGVDVERGRWERSQAKADREAHTQEQAATRASEAIADDTRAQAATQAAATDASTASSIETIRYVYRTQPPAQCRPGGPPVGVPAGVLDELDKAVAAVAGAKG
jgi:hypothetical protein